MRERAKYSGGFSLPSERAWRQRRSRDARQKSACEGLCEQSILRNTGLEQQGAKTRLSGRSVKNV